MIVEDSSDNTEMNWSDDCHEKEDLLLDFPQKPRRLTEHRRQASRYLALRRALNVAAASSASKIKQSTTTSSFVKYARDKIEFDTHLLDAELNFLDSLRYMDHEDRVDTLFELFDKDGNQLVSIVETKDFVLTRMKATCATKESIPAVTKVIARYERFDDYADRRTFAELAKEMQNAFNCDTFLEFCYLMAQKVAFNEDARTIIEDSIHASQAEAKTKSGALSQFSDVVIEARIILLFSILDLDGHGILSFSQVVKHLLCSSIDVDEVKRKILLTYDEHDLRTLNHSEFSEFMLNILAIIPDDISFHELADAVTLSVARNNVSQEHLKQLMIDPDTLIAKASVPTEHPTTDLVMAYGRLQRLFDMLDTNHDKCVNIAEFLPFLERYSPETSRDRKNAVFMQYDSNHDGRLDFEEFANMIIKFAGQDVDPHKLIDYLCVQVALSDDKQCESAYESSLHSLRSVKSLLGGSLTKQQAKRISFLNMEKRGNEKKVDSSVKSSSHPAVEQLRRKSEKLLGFGLKKAIK